MQRIKLNYPTPDTTCGRSSTYVSAAVLNLAIRLWGLAARHRLTAMAAQLRPRMAGHDLGRAIEAEVATEAASRLA